MRFAERAVCWCRGGDAAHGGEFWPTWLFYTPVVPYLGYLAAKHRGLTTFTAANPAIEGGGFVRESKFDILQGLAGAGEYVARSELIRGDRPVRQKVAAAMRFMATHDVTYPLVLKPTSVSADPGSPSSDPERRLTPPCANRPLTRSSRSTSAALSSESSITAFPASRAGASSPSPKRSFRFSSAPAGARSSN
jgi:hypothetical protein